MEAAARGEMSGGGGGGGGADETDRQAESRKQPGPYLLRMALGAKYLPPVSGWDRMTLDRPAALRMGVNTASPSTGYRIPGPVKAMVGS